MSKDALSTQLIKHAEATFRDAWAEKAADLMKEAADILSKIEDRKPDAYLGREKHPTPGKDGPAVSLAFPDSPRSALYEWEPLFR